MKLWILKPVTPIPAEWRPWYDKVFGFVVRAETEELARNFAANDCGAETRDAWLDSSRSSCKELNPEGKAGVVMSDFNAA